MGLERDKSGTSLRDLLVRWKVYVGFFLDDTNLRPYSQ